VLPIDDLRRLFGRLGTVALQFGAIEFTTEANPATVDAQKIELLASAGVNRISFGGQSFDRAELKALERLHDPDDIGPGIRLARAGGIAQVNLDLMFGIPGQTLESWRRNLSRAADFATDHLSCYGLTYEPHTALTARLERGLLAPCDEDLEAEMYSHCVDYLRQRGFEQYEISNFAQPGRRCQHNMVYWQNWPYLGIGPSAASYVSGVRSRNVAHIETYITEIAREGSAARDRECLRGPALAGETAMLQLRLTEGIDVTSFTSQVGVNPLALYDVQLRRLAADGLLQHDESSIRLTSRGRLVANYVVKEFLEPSANAIPAGHNSPPPERTSPVHVEGGRHR
jgi:oxygen-independent coproporphyrinogen-3 oxidase